MSRCFPFSNEAYPNRRLNHEALVKLHKEQTKAEKKREKEHKKISRKEHKKISRKEHKDKDKKKRHKYITCDGKVIKPCHKKHLSSKGDQSDQSEKSDLTVEIDPPECSGSVCNVENTLKRKRQDKDLLDGTKSPRTVLRVRLSLNRSESNSSLIKQQPINPNSCTKTEAVKLEPPSTKPPPPPCQDPKTNSQELKKLSIDRLLNGWVPLSLDDFTQNIVDDEDWLFGLRNHRCNQESKQMKPCHVTPQWPPRAKYLAEADVYVLPYIVPF